MVGLERPLGTIRSRPFACTKIARRRRRGEARRDIAAAAAVVVDVNGAIETAGHNIHAMSSLFQSTRLGVARDPTSSVKGAGPATRIGAVIERRLACGSDVQEDLDGSVPVSNEQVLLLILVPVHQAGETAQAPFRRDGDVPRPS